MTLLFGVLVLVGVCAALGAALYPEYRMWRFKRRMRRYWRKRLDQ